AAGDPPATRHERSMPSTSFSAGARNSPPLPSDLRMKPILLAFVMLVAGASAHGAEEAPRPFRAEYESLRNGDVLGRTTLSLADNRNGTWTLRSETRGTSG